MSSRAEARRNAILGRRDDRLNKLTSSARGEDHPVYSNVDAPSRKAPTTESFVGEESIMPTLSARPSPSTEPPRAEHPAGATRPSAWTNEEQQEFFHALMSAPEPNRTGAGSSISFSSDQTSFEPGSGDVPMSGLLDAFTQMGGQPPVVTEPAPRSLFSRLRPLLHLLASWALLAFFASVTEPRMYESISDFRAWSLWDRWAELSSKSAKQPFGVQPVPFFWAFVTLQLVLHSVQIFTKSDPIQPPTLLAVALPSLPPSWRAAITNVLVYARMGGMLLDDIAGLVVGLGILIWISGWLASGRLVS